MDKSTYNITISGTGVLPETTRASDLAALLINIEKAISETGRFQGVRITEDEIISLVGVDRSSNKLTFAVASILVSSVAMVSEVVETNTYERLPRQAHEALYEVSKQAVSHDWEVRFNKNVSLGIREATISKEKQIPPAPPTPYIEGTTSIYGRCIRVGGVRPKAEIQPYLYQGEILYITVSEAMAKELAKSLYEDVCIEGKAKWNTEDWTIAEFEGRRISEFRATDPVTAFQKLGEAAGGRWDGIDAIGYVKALRSEGETS
ncbi:MAG: hypothetical protein NTX52_11220 [Planctomycetota bacterium]|nr:hypothetical protein [Planctomycetota bacterium]